MQDKWDQENQALHIIELLRGIHGEETFFPFKPEHQRRKPVALT